MGTFHMKHSNTDERRIPASAGTGCHRRTPCAACFACFAAGGLTGALVMLALIVLAVLA